MHVNVKANHAGSETTLAVLRQQFWLTQGRREVKRFLRKCLTCKHWKTKPVQQKMAPLPAERVQIAPPFTHIDVDFTGPLYLKVKEESESSTSNAYVCIFVCENSRVKQYDNRGLSTSLSSYGQSTRNGPGDSFRQPDYIPQGSKDF